MSEAKRPRIVILNDDTTLMEVMEEVLTEEGYEVKISKEAETANALKLVKDWKPDLIILDLVTGNSNEREAGWRTLEVLRLDLHTYRIPVILCSGAAQVLRDKTDRLHRLGAEPLEKPFNIDELLECVARQLQKGPGQIQG